MGKDFTDAEAYEQEKEARVKDFEDLRNYCERTVELERSVDKSRRNTHLLKVKETEDYVISEKFSGRVIFASPKEAVEEISKTGNVGVLIGLSAVSKGGGVVHGMETFEAEICRHSTLYFCLQEKRICEEMYEDRAPSFAYIPGVKVVNKPYDSDKDYPEVDIIAAILPEGTDSLTSSEEGRRIFDNMLLRAEYNNLKTIIISIEELKGLL